MAHILVQVDGVTHWDGEVQDWATPAPPPTMPASIKAADLPPSIRAILAKAMSKALEQATGFKVDIHT